MPLDMFQSDTAAAVARAGRDSAPDLPATFTDTFSAAWHNGVFFGQSIANANAKTAALTEYADDMATRAGDEQLRPGALADPVFGTFDLDMMNQRINTLVENNPEMASERGVRPMSADDLEAALLAKSRGARADYARIGAQERTWGGTAGLLTGGLAAGVADPVNLLAFPLAAPAGLGVLGTSLAWGGIAAGTQAAIEVAGLPFHERVEPGYTASGEAFRNIGEAAVGGVVIGGGVKALGNAWTRVKTGEWPRSVRDAGNVVESEAQVQATNRYPGVEGETAHGQALGKTIDDIAAGRPVDVDGIVTPEMTAAYERRLDVVMVAKAEVEAARETAKAPDAIQGPPSAEVLANAEASVAQHIQDMAKSVGHDMPADEAALIAKRVTAADDNGSRQILDEVLMRPATVADTLADMRAPKASRETSVTPAEDAARRELAAEHTPERVAELRTDPEVHDAVSRDLDRLRAERGDFDIPMGETVNAAGERVPVMRKVEDVIAEADARLSAAQEIAACVGGQPDAGA